MLTIHPSIHVWRYSPFRALASLKARELAKEASNFQCKLWENHDLTVQPVITDIYFL
jgi:hypothetical protein